VGSSGRPGKSGGMCAAVVDEGRGRCATVGASGFMFSAVVQGKGHVGICGIRW
jgi:hypothetical protein